MAIRVVASTRFSPAPLRQWRLRRTPSGTVLTRTRGRGNPGALLCHAAGKPDEAVEVAQQKPDFVDVINAVQVELYVGTEVSSSLCFVAYARAPLRPASSPSKLRKTRRVFLSGVLPLFFFLLKTSAIFNAIADAMRLSPARASPWS